MLREWWLSVKWRLALVALIAVTGLITAVQAKGLHKDSGILAEENAVAVAANAEAIETVEALQLKSDSLAGDLVDTVTRLAALETGVSGLSTTVANWDSDPNDYNQAISDLEYDVKVLRSNLLSRIEQVENNKVVVLSLQESLAKVETSISALVDDVTALKAGPVPGTLERIAHYTTENGFTTDCLWSPIVGNYWSGQQFRTPVYTYDLMKVSLYLKRLGAPSAGEIRLYRVDSTGAPVGSPLFSYPFQTRPGRQHRVGGHLM